ncbi:MAG: 2-(1,2-epoxy-1,2-dihydrophenyl)acetyl-CoA isomerase [Kordiimonadaceae bacterium]|jgi:2-(1,2-epoxy-1,2-dihydrophenyl)acetyl-CoA isomerase|nr:2-(1,2-epoxy-1,2-dihydrophenyl)acetyl-CoA isomerase [Kordiimonadaceae bacterium]MBT6036390.1 2-(1,2-epoxy-1,2-dihydrophenyl)acetyl-CoA isomerase [Kordiimonadaceae bacterium]MBT6330479.1 2-(1,2-epoxy-1,2-dihydrophenyl)acetyl-CoA isomerase [Kordiimonadaceae bacterium]MBT7581493.1 2-(1,2-epoxy-1,2-dihydrophenyl)acetyl-CoA isomerase [Kordiimonadaceae bacterium]
MPKLILDTMELDYNGNIAILTLSREKALNAMNQDYFDNFKAVLNKLSAKSDLKALIITGRGNGFSVGADLKNLPIEKIDSDLDLGKSLRENFEPMVMGLKALPFPTIAAVNGYAAGAGMGLMLACDFTIAAKSAQFFQAFINIALVPDAGSSYFLPRIIGRARSTEMMMLGEAISADDALNMGLIYGISEEGTLMEDALRLAGKLATKPTSALIQIRALLDSSFENSLTDQLEAEAAAQQIAGKNENFKEGVTAFNEKRQPKFK